VWCTDRQGRGGWIPESFIEHHGDRGILRCDYDATELEAMAGEELTVENEQSGWLWCTNRKGESGWVPAENVEVSPENNPHLGLEARDCDFCRMPNERILMANRLAFAVRDRFPATSLHTLVIPKRHVASYFDLEPEEVQACHQLLVSVRSEILSHDATVRGFNVGVNQGQVAGQTIFHCHIHIIPRRAGDVGRPRGGVRHIIPGRGDYETR
jgi:diadenosine tetraphosphate (Ap4A) HIT family hydrolase